MQIIHGIGTTQVYHHLRDTMKFLIFVYFLLGSYDLCLLESIDESYPRVATLLGTIEGFYNISNGGRRYEAYEGIPYAQSPIGELRFEVAKSISSWTGVLEAKQPGSPCMQYDFIQANSSLRVSGSEDCLYLNIYAPVADDNCTEINGTQTNLLPVIFFIPGGAYVMGSGHKYGPKYLLDENVILVTFNYRLGPLGFLSTEDNIVPGNMGLKDQVIAMRWVKDNIQSFGGDPSRITLFGQSAGAASVHYHYLTNLTVGLFQGGMSLSGTVLNPWALVNNPLEKAKKLAAIVECPTDCTQSMVNCLKAQPVGQIMHALHEFTMSVYFPPKWAPSVEKGGGEFTFIDRNPIDIISYGDAHDLPWVTGVVDSELLYPLAYYIPNEDLFEPLNDDWETRAPYDLCYNDTILERKKRKIAKFIKKHYLGESPISRTTFRQLVQMYSDRWFVYGSQIAARSQAQANRGPVHVYYLTYRGAYSFSETLSGTNENFGVCHADDLAYVLDSFFDPTTTADDRAMQKVLIDLWVSFATNGTVDVGVEWPSLNQSSTDDRYTYLHIAGPNEIGMESALDLGELSFWSTIHFHENIGN